MTADNVGDFVVLTRGSDLPFRSRALADGYAVFQDDGECVLVHPDVRSALAQSARRADPLETGGLLVGRTMRDDGGPYVIVVGSVPAPREASGHGTFSLTPEMTTALRDRAARLYPGVDVIGWWHSHPIWSGYSPVDRRNQRMWTDPRHLGLLVFMRPGGEWARAYLGPDSREIPTVADAPPNLRPVLMTTPSAARRPHEPHPAADDNPPAEFVVQRVQRWRLPKLHRPAAGRPVTRRRPPVARLALVIFAGLAAALLVGLVTQALFTPEGSSEGPPTPVGTRTTLTCSLAKSQTSYQCEPNPAPSSALEWRIDGKVAAAKGPVLSVPVQASRDVKVDLFVKGPDGKPVLVASVTLQPARGGRGDGQDKPGR